MLSQTVLNYIELAWERW